MKQIFFACLFLGLSIVSFGQTGKLTGSVLDSATKTPLDLATITVLGLDSSVVAYKLSDKNGLFTIDKLPLKRKLLVNVSYTGYAGYHTYIQQDTARTDSLSVLLSLNSSEAVVVTAVIPIRMNGDTLEINPAAFKMKEDAVVEEMLNQVSGITIWSDGTITVNGKKVQNLLVDGKPFMGATDTRIATQNLPKSAIEKIQLYQEYDRTKIGQPTQPQDSLLTMNLKLKEGSKKGYFGKAGVGLGTRDRFESDLSFQLYNKKSSAGFGGGFNNINKNIGNLQEMFQNNTYRNFNPNLYNVGRFGTNGINKNHSFGGVVVHNFIESANSRQNDRLTLNYNKSGTDAFISDKSYTNRTAAGLPQFIRDEGEQNNLQNRHEIGLRYVKTNSYSDNFDINGAVGTSNQHGNSTRFTEVRDAENKLLSTSHTTTQSSQRSDNQSLRLSFSKSNGDDPLKGFNAQLNAGRGHSESERDMINVFESFTVIGQNTYTNRRYATNSDRISLSGNVDYLGLRRLLLGRFNLFGVDLQLGQWYNYSKVTDNTIVTDYDTVGKLRNYNSKLSNSNRRELLEYTPSLTLSKSVFKFSDKYYKNFYAQLKLLEDFKTDRNGSSLKNRNLDRSFQFFRYEGSLNYNYTRREKYNYRTSLYYTKSMEYPTIDRLYAIVDDINNYDIRVGNPRLKNSTNHSLNLNANFNTENGKSLYAINGAVGGGYYLTANPVTDSVINDTSGKRTTYYLNADKNQNFSLNYNLNISRRIDKSNLQLMYNGELRAGQQPNYIDRVYNISNTQSLMNQFTLQFSLNSVLVLTAAHTMQMNKTRSSSSKFPSFKNKSNISKFGIVVNYPAGFTLSSTAEYVTNTNIDKPFVLWNSFATYRFMKQQGELKFSAMDLLKKYQNISNSVYKDGTSTRIANGLQQYFLLTFSYYPRKFGKTEIKRQGN